MARLEAGAEAEAGVCGEPETQRSPHTSRGRRRTGRPEAAAALYAPGFWVVLSVRHGRKHVQFILRRSDLILLRSHTRSEHLAHGCWCRPAPAGPPAGDHRGGASPGESKLSLFLSSLRK